MDSAGHSEQMQGLRTILTEAVASNASDVHLAADSPIIFRVAGQLVRQEGEPLTAEGVHNLIYQAITSQQREEFEANKELDASYEIPGVGRFRINVHKQQDTVGAAIRSVPIEIPKLRDLDLPLALAEVPHYTHGLVLVTGATGAGKSTTLAAILNEINHERDAHIVTIEDPVEYRHTSDKCLVTHREVGRDTGSFAEALRRALRQDPDVILVGELRDRESMRVAMEAAGTGHLVLSTVHATTAKDTIDRIIESFPGDEQNAVRSHLAQTLRMIVSQVLLRSAVDPQQRLVAAEVLKNTSAARAMIKDNKIHQIPSVIQAGQSQGMNSLSQSLVDLVARNAVTYAEALHHCNDVDELHQLLNPQGRIRAVR